MVKRPVIRANLYRSCGKTNRRLDLFITEALHPFNVFRKAGFEVDLVSESGAYQADWLSQQKEWLHDEDRKVWEDHSSEFRSKLDKLLKPSDIKFEDVRNLLHRSHPQVGLS